MTAALRNRIAAYAALVLACAAAGFGGGYAGSYLHPGATGPAGPRGVEGAQGPTGSTGPAGAQGPAGQPPAQLGVCFSSHSSSSAGVYWIDAVSVAPPRKHPDGTVDCVYGVYVAVAPQS